MEAKNPTDKQTHKQSHKAPTESPYDLVIIGGGMVGASLACALKGQALNIALVESVPLESNHQPSYDDRAIALSYGSARVFQSIGVWPGLSAQATAIEHIHVSDQGHFGATRMHATDEKVPALGYVASARDIGNALHEKLQQLDNLSLYCPATLEQLDIKTDVAQLTVKQGEQTLTLPARLVVAADGGQSQVRKLLGIQSQVKDYGQTAIVANISSSEHHNNVAYERFTPHGPLALLPLGEKQCSLVWTRHPDKVAELMELPEQAFLAQLQQDFGYRLGRLTKVGRRHAFPLRLLHTQQQVQPRMALIGNAAHTLHPIAGQGFNLGLRDVATLAQIVVEAKAQGKDPGKLGVLQQYYQWRSTDQQQIIGITDTLVNLFSNDNTLMALARNLGLVGMDLIPTLKSLLAKYTMGLANKQTRLARGLPLYQSPNS